MKCKIQRIRKAQLIFIRSGCIPKIKTKKPPISLEGLIIK